MPWQDVSEHPNSSASLAYQPRHFGKARELFGKTGEMPAARYGVLGKTSVYVLAPVEQA